MIGTLTTFIASVGFMWVVCIIGVIAMAILLEKEMEGWATTVFSLAIALLLWNYKGDIFGLVTQHPAAVIGFVVSYVIIGVLWSFLKWRSYVKNIFDNFMEIKTEFLRANKVIDKDNKNDFKYVISKAKFKDSDGVTISLYSHDTVQSIVEKITPLASKKKTVITSWISYWPVSLIATLLNDPFRKFFEWIYSRVSGYYERITNAYKKDLLV